MTTYEPIIKLAKTIFPNRQSLVKCLQNVLDDFQKIHYGVIKCYEYHNGYYDGICEDLQELMNYHDSVVRGLVYLRQQYKTSMITSGLDNMIVQYLHKCCTTIPPYLLKHEYLTGHFALHSHNTSLDYSDFSCGSPLDYYLEFDRPKKHYKSYDPFEMWKQADTF